MQPRTLGALAVSAVLTLTCASVSYAEQWVGGDQGEVKHGTADPDQYTGNGGDDKIWGEGGNDELYGNTGDDVVHGGDGKDRVDVGFQEDTNASTDKGYGDDGADYVLGRGPDKLYGGAGKDMMYVLHPTAATVVNCGPGNDWLSANRKRFPGKKIGCEHYSGTIGGKRLVALAAGVGH